MLTNDDGFDAPGIVAMQAALSDGNFCDADFTGGGLHTGADIAPFIALLQASDIIADMNCDGLLTGADIAPFIAVLQSGTSPGPSGLPCAGTIPCM